MSIFFIGVIHNRIFVITVNWHITHNRIFIIAVNWCFTTFNFCVINLVNLFYVRPFRSIRRMGVVVRLQFVIIIAFSCQTSDLYC
ncbi:hypothetical protein GLOIN_2v1582961, partial [Rhizophagus irregularis DAOM 181602=DAOM 197198]